MTEVRQTLGLPTANLRAIRSRTVKRDALDDVTPQIRTPKLWRPRQSCLKVGAMRNMSSYAQTPAIVDQPEFLQDEIQMMPAFTPPQSSLAEQYRRRASQLSTYNKKTGQGSARVERHSVITRQRKSINKVTCKKDALEELRILDESSPILVESHTNFDESYKSALAKTPLPFCYTTAGRTCVTPNSLKPISTEGLKKSTRNRKISCGPTL